MDQSNAERITQELKDKFPDKVLEPKNLQSLNFQQWKVVNIKQFLNVFKAKGISKLNKDALVALATIKWKELCSASYCASSSLSDEELLNRH